MFAHGLVRLPKLNGFSQWMVGQFEKSMLPKIMVLPFSYVLPVAEFVIGTLLILGFLTRPALVAGGLVMVVLIFGAGMIEDWGAIPSQLIHAFFFGLLLSSLQHNGYALDTLTKK